MQNIVTLIDYEEKYADTINKIEEQQWGGSGDIRYGITKHTCIKLAKINEDIAGVGYGKRIGDAFYIQVIVIKPEYQHIHIGSMFMDYFIDYAKSHELSNIVCEGVLTNNKMNAENLLKKYNFKEVIRVKEYWGYRYPESYCKECGCKPCKCTGVIFVKNIK